MKNFNYSKVEGRILFFHICTDGENNGIVHTCDKDYQQASIIMAVCAYKAKVHIICFVHMSTHSHIVIWCETKEQADLFAAMYKRDYARYAAMEHGLYKIFQGVDDDPIEITDIIYLKNCISYTLLNPVVPGIVKRPEDYKWSSFKTYFNETAPESIPVPVLGVKKTRKLLKTHTDLSMSRLCVFPDGNMDMRSFVDYRFVEKLFGGQTELFRSFDRTDSVAEEERYVHRTVKFNDNELFAEALSLTEKLFHKTDLRVLTKSDKKKVLLILMKKTGASPKRISRVLRLDPKEVDSLLGQPK